METKKEDLKFINDYTKITVAKICEDFNVNRQNVYNGKTSEENLHKIRKEIEFRLSNLYRGEN